MLILWGYINTRISHLATAIYIFNKLPNNNNILGFTISNNLLWNSHMNNIIKKANKRLFYLVQF